MTAVTFGAWNVRTLLDRAGTNRPERRTALIAHELNRYNVQIAALSETRLADEGHLTEQSAGYTFFWIGRGQNEQREAGVGFAIKSNLARKLKLPPKVINDRLMNVRLPLPKKKFATLISAYAPTMSNPDEVKDKFYEDLKEAIAAMPNADKLIILGDFNARVSRDHASWEGVLGKHGIGKCNSNGLLLLETCAAHDLLITNTVFCLPNRNKTSWMHPRSKHRHLLDYVIVRQRDRQDVRVTKTMCGAECVAAPYQVAGQLAEMEGIHAILLRHQLRWAGHVHRMDDCRLPKRLFYGELSTGKRTTGRPKKRYKNTFKEALKLCTIPQTTWHEIAVDRTA